MTESKTGKFVVVLFFQKLFIVGYICFLSFFIIIVIS